MILVYMFMKPKDFIRTRDLIREMIMFGFVYHLMHDDNRSSMTEYHEKQKILICLRLDQLDVWNATRF